MTETGTLDQSVIPLRLRKYLSKHTTLSNKEIKQAFHDGNIEVTSSFVGDPAPLSDLRGLNAFIFPETDRVSLNGQLITPKEGHGGSDVFLFHKPGMSIFIVFDHIFQLISSLVGFECVVDREDEGENNTVTRWLRDLPAGCVPVGM